MDLTNAFTTAQVADTLNITTKEIDRLLNKYPVPPPNSFGKVRAWTEKDVDTLRLWEKYDREGSCPFCANVVEVRKVAPRKPKPAAKPAPVEDGDA